MHQSYWQRIQKIWKKNETNESVPTKTESMSKKGWVRGQRLFLPVSWRLNGWEVDCVGHLEVVAQSFVQHELSALKHHREYIYEGVKEKNSQPK